MTTPDDRHVTPTTDPCSVRCSFCNEGPETVGELLEGPAWPGCTPAYVCEDCAELCAQLLEQRRTFGGAEQVSANQKMMEQEIHRRLSILSSLEGAVVKLRYGLGYAETYSFDKIGELLGLTPERVSEIEKQAIEKTRTFKPGA